MDESGPLSSSPPSAAGRRGLSLIEIVLVLAIIATAAAIAAPRYASALARYRVEMASHRVQADLEAARLRARAASATWSVEFHVAQHAYKMYDGTDAGAAETVSLIDLTRAPYEVRLHDVSFSPTPAAIFDGYGVPLQAGGVSLEAGGYYRSVSVEPVTGRVTVSETLGIPPVLPPPS